MTCFRLLVASLLLGLLGVSTASADGLIVITKPLPDHHVIRDPHPPHPHPPRPWPRPQPPRVYSFAPMQVEYHHVTVTIKDQVAITEVDQSFFNPNNARLEGHYIFPLPKGAEIDKFSMDINGKQQQAELLDADKARKIYTDIVRSMKDPALMEYADRGMFKVRIFPIEPHSKKRIKIKYTQVLKSDSGLVGYTYPLSTEKFSSAPIKDTSVKVTLDTHRPIKTVYSPSHKVEVNRKGDNHATIGWEVKNDKPDTDFQLFFSTRPRNGEDIAVNLMAFNEHGSSEGHFMLFIAPGQLSDRQIAKKDVVFVMDTSGSMAGEKMEQAKKALRFCIANLNDGDRFEIVRFSTEAEPLFDGLVKADKANRDKAGGFIDGLKPIGGTAIEEALVKAVKTIDGSKKKGRPQMVIFLTDGRPTIGSTDENAILTSVKKAAGDDASRIFCFGIGTDINTHLLDKITDETRAASQYVMPTEDIEVKVSSFFNKISHPVLADVELKFKGDVRVSKLYPSPLPDVFRGDQLVLLGRYENQSGGETVDAAIQLIGYVDGEQKTMTYEASFPRRASEHTFIPRLWATRRVGYLLEQIRLHGSSNELKEEVTRLAKQYGIVTPYTSYLILEDEARHRHAPRLSAATTPGVAPNSPEAKRRMAELRDEAGATFDRFRGDKSGAEAVGGARANEALKQADTADASREADQLARQGIGQARPGSTFGNAAGQPGAQPTDDADGAAKNRGRGGQIHVSKYVAGRTFYFNGETWVDAKASDLDAEPKKITFNSDEYFELMTEHPDAAKWLALGTRVIVVLDGKAYEIVEKE